MFLILHLSSGHNGGVLVAPLLIFSNPGHEGVINKNGRNIFFKNKKDDVCFFFQEMIIFRGVHGSQLLVHACVLSESVTLCPCYTRKRPSNFRLEKTLS